MINGLQATAIGLQAAAPSAQLYSVYIIHLPPLINRHRCGFLRLNSAAAPGLHQGVDYQRVVQLWKSHETAAGHDRACRVRRPGLAAHGTSLPGTRRWPSQ